LIDIGRDHSEHVGGVARLECPADSEKAPVAGITEKRLVALNGMHREAESSLRAGTDAEKAFRLDSHAHLA
jgi:hypothetical protein